MELNNNEKEWEVKKILNFRIYNIDIKYLVK